MTRLVGLLVMLIFSCAAHADLMIVEVVPLKHRLATDVLPTLTALVVEGGTVSALDQKLIIRTTPANLAELKIVVAGVDTRQCQLRILVRQNVENASRLAADQLAAQLRIGNGDLTLGAAGPGDAPGAAFNVAGARAGASIESYRTQDHDDVASTHFISAVEGVPAYIATGTAVPLPQASAVLTPFGANVQQSLAYRDVGSGVYVTARFAGEDVTLEISPYSQQLDRRGGGMIAERSANTVVRGRLGGWLPLAGSSNASHDQNVSELSTTTHAESTAYDVWVKVEVTP